MMEPFVLRKMRVKYAQPIEYFWDIDDVENVSVNALIGKNISLTHSGLITCQGCGKKTKKSFAQGFCYTCFQTNPATEACVLRPELCKIHLGEARDIEWAKRNHLAPHFVYLAFSSNIKVGITRHNQIPIRWIDQGALQAIQCLEVPNRHIAGVAEVFLKNYYSDKSAWQKMLQTIKVGWDIDLEQEKQNAVSNLPEELRQYVVNDNTISEFQYPVNHLADKLSTLSFDKTPVVKGKLTGIKGQYLVFDNKNVINLRKHTGYEIALKIED